MLSVSKSSATGSSAPRARRGDARRAPSASGGRPFSPLRQFHARSKDANAASECRVKPLCDMHRSRMRRYGDLGAADPKIGPRGGGSVKSDGYHVTKVGSRQIGTHRLVMEQVLGRPLEPWESVHHRNGKRADNRAENLELWAKAQPYGQRVSDLVDFIVKHYRGDVLAALSRED